MKKVFLAGILMTGLSAFMVSCNNGDYNANPDRNTDILNPLNPNSGVTIPLGRVQAELDGSMRVFDQAAGWTDSIPTTAIFQGFKYSNAHTAEFLGATLTPYAGATGSYNVGDTVSNDIFYGVMDTNTKVTYFMYNGKITSGGSGPGSINLKGTESGRLRGTFTGTLYKVVPVLDFGDVIQVTNGEFYVKKH